MHRPAWPIVFLIAMAAACSLLAPDDDELLSDRNASGGNTGGSASGSAGRGASSGSGGSSGAGESGQSGAGGSSGTGGSSEPTGSGGLGVGGKRGIDGVPGESGGTGGAGATIPTAGLVLWLKGDAGVTAASGLVNEWRDQSGSNNHATQPLASAQPSVAAQWRAGKAAVRFDGAQDFLSLPPMRFGDFSQGLSLFVVADSVGSNNCIPFIQFSNGDEVDDISFYRDPNGGLTYEVLTTQASCPNAVFPPLTARVAAVVQAPSGLATVYAGGQSCAAPTIAAAGSVIRNNVTIGRVPFAECSLFAGNIAELLVYGRALLPAETSSVQGYLGAKWAL